MIIFLHGGIHQRGLSAQKLLNTKYALEQANVTINKIGKKS